MKIYNTTPRRCPLARGQRVIDGIVCSITGAKKDEYDDICQNPFHARYLDCETFSIWYWEVVMKRVPEWIKSANIKG